MSRNDNYIKIYMITVPTVPLKNLFTDRMGYNLDNTPPPPLISG